MSLLNNPPTPNLPFITTKLNDNHKPTSTPTEEDIKFLNKKRNLTFLQNNYLVRRILSPIQNKDNEYEKISNLYYLLMSFDWNNELYSKNSLIQNLRGNSLWFYICSTYFPYVSNELIDNKKYLPDIIRKFIIERQSLSKSIYKRNSPVPKKEKFINEILSLSKKYTLKNNTIANIDTLVNYYENFISIIENINNTALEQKINNHFILNNNYDSNISYDEYLRMDMEFHSKSLKKFIDYIKSKNELRNTSLDENDPDDVVCVICNDGDYEDDNLIVYCSLCHITVHQKCYGIHIVPKDDWLCQSCQIYNDEKISDSLECILCPVKGGAMKPCSLKKTSAFYSYLMSLRNQEHFSYKINTESPISPAKTHFTTTQNIFTTLNESSNSSFTTSHGNSNSNEKICYKNANEHSWIHMSCALWIPEIVISNYEAKDKIKGIESIGKKRFLEKCEICLLKGFGPTIKCERCDLRFHVECARKNKFQLESTDNQMGENKFHIFCQKHAPHKLVKYRELKKQREIDDIKQFANIIEKNIDFYNKNHKNSELSVYNKAKGEKSSSYIYTMQHKLKLNTKERKSFINAIRTLAFDISNMNIEIYNKDYSIIQQNGQYISLSYIDILSPSKFPWYMLKDTESYLQGMKPIEIFRLFKSLIPNEVEYNKVILKKSIKVNKNNKGKQIYYCYCHKNDDAFMIGCEMADKCINNGWYHLECVDELKQFTPEDVTSDKFGKYYCPECRKKYNIQMMQFDTFQIHSTSPPTSHTESGEIGSVNQININTNFNLGFNNVN